MDEKLASAEGVSIGFAEYVTYMQVATEGTMPDNPWDDQDETNLKYYLKFFDHIYDQPDTPYGRKALKWSNMYIYNYCLINKITLDDYCKQPHNQIHQFILHLKTRKTILTSLYDIPNFFNIFNQYSIATRRFLFGNTADRVQEYYTTYLSSEVKRSQKKILENIDTVLKRNKDTLL